MNCVVRSVLSPTSSSGDSELSPSEDSVDEEVFIFSSESTSELVEASFTCLLAKIGCVFCCLLYLWILEVRNV